MTRRSKMKIAANMDKMLQAFKVDDIVVAVASGDELFTGAITRIDPKICKVFVNWGDGLEAQHGPDEIKLLPYVTGLNPIERMRKVREASCRRGRLSGDNPSGDQFVGNPDKHGIDTPITKGFGVMQDLVKQQRKEIMKETKDGPKIASSRSRSAVYWGAPGRTYRMTKREQELGVCCCPKCKKDMERQPFTRSDKLWTCPECGFKVPTSNLTKQRVEIEISPNGEIEVEVTAGMKSRRQ